MKIVIDIEEKRFRDIQRISTVQLKGRTSTLEQVIAHGTPLPKGHGRIGDLSKIYDRLNDAQIEGTVEYKGLGEAKQIICDAPAIIEADKESEE